MDPVTPALIGTGLFLGSFLYKHWLRHHFQSAAASCGLRVVKVSNLWAPTKLTAQAGPLEVRIVTSLRGKSDIHVVVVIPGPPGFSGLKLRRESSKPYGAREIEVGDEAFDSRFFIEGPMRLVFTLLDAETRGLLIKVNSEVRGMKLMGGELRAEAEDLYTLLPLLVDLGKRLAQPVDVAQRLAENATQDPEARVRLMNLLLLAREFPREPGTLEALRSACSDPSLEVRLRAAKELGAEGRGVLVEIAESPVDDALSAQAVSILGQELPFERTKAILDHALRRRRLKTARACLESLGHTSDSGATAVDVLTKVMTREQGELAAVAAQALGTAGSPAAEGPLLQALRREQKDLRVAAATALGRVGSPAAVLPLKETAERFESDPDLSRATRQAVAEIQSRLPGASPGQLSLAGAEVGQLSLAQGDAGQLSLANDPGGQLSLQPEETSS
jgi:HEAT repeat protein